MSVAETHQCAIGQLYTRSWFDTNEDVSSNAAITTQKAMDGSHVTLSCYGDEIWIFPDSLFPSCVRDCDKKLKFKILKNQNFVPALKLAIIRYYYLGRPGYKRPRGTTLVKVFRQCVVFFNYLTDKNIGELDLISSFVGAQYANYSKMQPGLKGEYSNSTSVAQRLIAVETLYELLLNTKYMFSHPWPDATIGQLSGVARSPVGKTLIIPDEYLKTLMEKSASLLLRASTILLNMNRLLIWTNKKKSKDIIDHLLTLSGYPAGTKYLNEEIANLRSACALIVLITTGIRAHELLSLETGCCYTSVNEDGTKYHWLKGISTKTGEGATEWMCPEICHQAVGVLEKIARPLQDVLSPPPIGGKTIIQPLVAVKNSKNKNRIFLLKAHNKDNSVRSQGTGNLNSDLKKFVLNCGVEWRFATHQCRRTFAVYVVKNALGDLRYLRDHYKHWSIDMTAMYAENELQDKELFAEIYLAARDEKTQKVKHWLDQDTPLSGGMAHSIKVFRSQGEPIRSYKNRVEMIQSVSESISLRATGVAWCTADQGGCDAGKAFDNTKCGDCRHSIIDERFHHRWKAIYKQQLELIKLDDVGVSGRESAIRALERCKIVLTELGATSGIFEV